MAFQNEGLDLPILLVEDQRSLAAMMSAMLADRWGCAVHVASSLKETRALIDSGTHFLVALCDLNLPDAEHAEVIDTVTQAGIPAVALTAAFGEELRDSILKKGVVDYVLKEGINAYAYVCDLVGRLSKNRSIKVLVADDSLSMRTLLKQILERYGLQVLVAHDGAEGLELLRTHPDIRAMLVDYNMPVMDGFTLTVEARKTHGKDRLAIIGIAASDDPMLSARFLKNGANDFIRKPFSYEEVVCRVNQNLDMLELIETNQKAANLDFLTGLSNRRHFFDQGGRRYTQAVKAGTPVAAAMLDIDYFKRINDHWGHDGGDAVLRAFSGYLGEAFRDHLAARLGGEEFVVLAAGTPPEAFLRQLEGFRAQVASQTIPFGEQAIACTVSIGLASGVHGDLEALLRDADANLYRAKESGRNRIVGPKG